MRRNSCIIGSTWRASSMLHTASNVSFGCSTWSSAHAIRMKASRAGSGHSANGKCSTATTARASGVSAQTCSRVRMRMSHRWPAAWIISPGGPAASRTQSESQALSSIGTSLTVRRDHATGGSIRIALHHATLDAIPGPCAANPRGAATWLPEATRTLRRPHSAIQPPSRGRCWCALPAAPSDPPSDHSCIPHQVGRTILWRRAGNAQGSG